MACRYDSDHGRSHKGIDDVSADVAIRWILAAILLTAILGGWIVVMNWRWRPKREPLIPRPPRYPLARWSGSEVALALFIFVALPNLAVAALQQPNLPPDDGYVEAAPPSDQNTYSKTGLFCQACGAELEKRPTKSKPQPGQRYFYEYHHRCPGCGRIYLVEEAKRSIPSASRESES